MGNRLHYRWMIAIHVTQFGATTNHVCYKIVWNILSLATFLPLFSVMSLYWTDVWSRLVWMVGHSETEMKMESYQWVLLYRKHHSQIPRLLTFRFGYKFNPALPFSETHRYKMSLYESQQVATPTNRHRTCFRNTRYKRSPGRAVLYIANQFGATSRLITYKRIQMHRNTSAWGSNFLQRYWGAVKVKQGEQ